MLQNVPGSAVDNGWMDLNFLSGRGGEKHFQGLHGVGHRTEQTSRALPVKDAAGTFNLAHRDIKIHIGEPNRTQPNSNSDKVRPPRLLFALHRRGHGNTFSEKEHKP